jgi:hypothetical protein
MKLIAHFQDRGWRRIAFVGAAKHAGKTTAMNYLITEASEAGISLGLCSFGLDGERLDTILGVAKPPVFVPAGTLVASAERALEQSQMQWEYLEDTSISSPLGNILIARAVVPGEILLAGVRQRRHVDTVLPRLEALGAAMSFVDGAFQRVAAAVPETVDAAVLAVGAVMGETVSEVTAYAHGFLQRFQLPLADQKLRKVFQPVVDAGAMAGWNGRSLVWFDRHQAVLGLRDEPSWSGDISHLWLPGAASDAVLQSLAGHPQTLTVVIAHPAQLLAPTETLQKWFRLGHQLLVWETLPIAAVAVNPHSIVGYDLSEHDLTQSVATLLSEDIPVFNALTVAGGENHG